MTVAEDRHKHKPKSVRIPGGLLAWLADQAAIEGRRPNAVIVAALEEYRERHDSTSIPAPARGVTTLNGGITTYSDQPRSDCKHPAEYVEAGECGICHADVW